MRGSDRRPAIVALGEPLAELTAEQRGRLGEVRTLRRSYGGDTSNFIVAAARMGAACGYVTRVGDDEFGRAFLALWKREGIDTRGVVVERDGFTGVYFVSQREEGGHDFTYYRANSAASHLRPDDLDLAYLAGVPVLHTSGISQAISGTARETVEVAIETVRRGGGTISYDVNFRPRLWPAQEARPVIERTLGHTDIAFLSGEDMAQLYPDTAWDAVLERVQAAGPKIVAMKRGGEGCLILTAEGEQIALPAWPVEVADTTGAGDAFAGAFVSAWLLGAGPAEAVRLANAVGAITSTGLGAVEPIPTRDVVQAFLAAGQAGIRRRRE